MRRTSFTPRTVALFVALALSVPPPAFALRGQQQEDPSLLTGLEEALRDSDKALRRLVQRVTPPLFPTAPATPSVTPAANQTGLEELGRPRILPHRRAVIFGIGKIGRGYLAPLLTREKNNFDVIFVDVSRAQPLINAVNKQGIYTVTPVGSGKRVKVRHVWGILNDETETATARIAAQGPRADWVFTAVGSGQIIQLAPVLRRYIQERIDAGRMEMLNIIFAENLPVDQHQIKDTRQAVLQGADGNFRRYVDERVNFIGIDPLANERFGEYLENRVGFVGAVVQITVPEQKSGSGNPLDIQVEAGDYHLIVDKKELKGTHVIPSGIQPVSNIRAYRERKLYIHNMGHAMLAYLSAAKWPDEPPDKINIARGMGEPPIYNVVQRAMEDVAEALAQTYPKEFTKKEMKTYVANLLGRFANGELNDDVERVGKDAYIRKLQPTDRLFGAAAVVLKEMGRPSEAITLGIYAGLLYAQEREGVAEEQLAKIREYAQRLGLALPESEGVFWNRLAAGLEERPLGASPLTPPARVITRMEVEEISATPEGKTLRARSHLSDGTVGRWFVLPAGTSTGEQEALTVGFPQAKENIERILSEVSRLNLGEDLIAIHERVILPLNQSAAQALNRLPDRYGGLGGDAVLPFEAAAAYAAAQGRELELADYLRQLFPEAAGAGIPYPLMVVWSGGLHAPGKEFGKDKISVQEILIDPSGAPTLREAKKMGQEIRRALAEELSQRGIEPGESKEGAVAPIGVGSVHQAIRLILEAARKSGYEAGRDFHLRLDAAANSFFDGKRYNWDGQGMTTEELIQAYVQLNEVSPGVIRGIEDPFAESDPGGWRQLKNALPSWDRVADDLTATQLDLVHRFSDFYDILLVKPNQAGSLVDTLRTIARAKRLGKEIILSHRSREGGQSSEEADVLISHIAEAVGARFLKTMPWQPVRIAKVDELIRLIDRRPGEPSVSTAGMEEGKGSDKRLREFLTEEDLTYSLGMYDALTVGDIVTFIILPTEESRRREFGSKLLQLLERYHHVPTIMLEEAEKTSVGNAVVISRTPDGDSSRFLTIGEFILELGDAGNPEAHAPYSKVVLINRSEVTRGDVFLVKQPVQEGKFTARIGEKLKVNSKKLAESLGSNLRKTLRTDLPPWLQGTVISYQFGGYQIAYTIPVHTEGGFFSGYVMPIGVKALDEFLSQGYVRRLATAGLEERMPGWLDSALGTDWMKVVAGVHEMAQVTDKVAVLLQPELLGVAGDDGDTEVALMSLGGNLHSAFGWPDETTLWLGLLSPESAEVFEEEGYRVIRILRHPESEETPLPWEAIPLVVAEALTGGRPTFWVNVTPYLNLKGITLPEILSTLIDLFA